MGEKTRICFQVNNFCNLNCTYCYEKNKGHKQMAISHAKSFLDNIFSDDNSYFNGYFIKPIEGITLDFIGGEATLSMSVVDEITNYFYKKCIEQNKIDWIINSDIWLETNGTTYFNSDVKGFIDKHSIKLDLPITIDGDKKLHDTCRKYYDGRGSYDDVERAVIHYRDTYKKMPNSKITLSPQNVRYFYDAILNVIKLGYTNIRCSCQMEDVWDSESENEYYRQLTKIYDYLLENKLSFVFSPMREFESKCNIANCGVYGSMICLDYDGNIFNCFRYSDVSIKNRTSMRLGTVENGVTNLNILNDLRERLNAPMDQKCQKCNLLSACEFCPAFNYQYAGSLSKNLKTNCRITHIEAKAFKEFQDRCKEIGFDHPMASTKNDWNEDLFEQNEVEGLRI